jgi:hypothetical protein
MPRTATTGGVLNANLVLFVKRYPPTYVDYVMNREKAGFRDNRENFLFRYMVLVPIMVDLSTSKSSDLLNGIRQNYIFSPLLFILKLD